MISKIELRTIPFDNTTQSLNALRTFNYIFGANGSGKTTISRIIAAPEAYPNCRITWHDGIPFESRVYNREFIENNLQNRLKGVFTLGEMQANTLENIEKTKAAIVSAYEEISGLSRTLQGDDGNGGRKAELVELTSASRTKFWKQKQKHADKLGSGLTGYLGDSTKFMNKVLEESEKNEATLLDHDELEKKAEAIFSNVLTSTTSMDAIDISSILTHEKNPILQKRIIGKQDVSIAEMIKKLGNSDWVRQGRSYFEVSDSICPFCQQKTNEDFAKSLNEYFDESFAQDSAAINKLINDYAADAQLLQRKIQGMIDMQSEFLETEKLKSEKQILDSTISINVQRLVQKKKETSQAIALDSLENVLTRVVSLIGNANESIEKQNTILKNLPSEKATLTSQIWRYIASNLSIDISEYKRKKFEIDNAMSNLTSQIDSKTEKWHEKKMALQELEKQTTSIIPTRDGINKLLDSFGFKSFKLAIGDDNRTYKLIRENGTEAKHTLSEGEKNFVAFLYFYYLLKGSQTETGFTNDKVVVFDDPISSLDNDALFIVSTLIRDLAQDVRDKKVTIKQVFILTHNIYFHKEVTYNWKRKEKSLPEESFWLVRKNGSCSTIEKQTTNPIKTSYDLLWDEVRKDTRNNATIQNTLRRILENYFKLLGNIPIDKLYKKFDGEDKVKCKALCSWVNDGSHSVFDEDFYTSLDEAMIRKCLKVFKQIFLVSGHIAHYNMMMDITQETEPIAAEEEQ